MIDQSLAQPAPTTTREQRGLVLWRDHADAIRFDADERVWLIPSVSDGGTSVYEVSIGRKGESCECRDFEFHGERQPCKHIVAATIARAKTAACSGCGGRFPHRELVEAMEDDFGTFEGERYCPPCASRVGVR
ncbi:MAG: SWIM zinc finger domain-containing protein [Actinomycetota bacterium]|nr:SWIM zinc finger domain-containing protein [Actinomycetota bacterium]